MSGQNLHSSSRARVPCPPKPSAAPSARARTPSAAPASTISTAIPIICPICEHASTSSPSRADGGRCRRAAEEKAAAQAGQEAGLSPLESAKPEDAPEAEGEEALAAIEGEEEPAAAEEDETFLEEEEEDGADMSGIIGGPVAEPDEPQ